MNPYVTSPREIADALQSLAEDLRAMPDAEVSKTCVTVYIQAHASHGTPEERVRSVDVLGWLVAGATGAREADGAYRTPYGAGDRPGLDVRVFTGHVPDGTR